MDMAEWQITMDAAVRRLVVSKALLEEYRDHKAFARVRHDVRKGIFRPFHPKGVGPQTRKPGRRSTT